MIKGKEFITRDGLVCLWLLFACLQGWGVHMWEKVGASSCHKKGRKCSLAFSSKISFSELHMPENRGAFQTVELVCKFLEIFYLLLTLCKPRNESLVYSINDSVLKFGYCGELDLWIHFFQVPLSAFALFPLRVSSIHCHMTSAGWKVIYTIISMPPVALLGPPSVSVTPMCALWFSCFAFVILFCCIDES
jgi:hypothetical protein